MASSNNGIAKTATSFNRLWLRPDPMKRTRIKKAMDIEFDRDAEVVHRVPRNLFWQLSERKPRCEDMSVRQDWPNVWPAAQSFRSSVVPLPLRMGYAKEGKVPRGTYGNLELMKLPNFLHLTPLHVQRHCEAIKKFCTKFPEQLKRTDMQEQYTPLRLSYSDFVHQSNNIRDVRARVVTATIRLTSMQLKDTHAYNKCRQLLGDRFDEKTGVFTIVSDRCPLRKQNTDYVNYLVTVLWHESHRTEKWEATQVQELLEMRERDRMEEEGEPESERQKELMMKPSMAKAEAL